MTGKYELTAAQWRKIETILPGKKGDRAAGQRQIIGSL